jgi:hypothetical protein
MPFIEEGIERGQGFIVDVSRTHPMRLTAGILQENPFYMPPDEFLRELQSRNPREAAAAS